MATVKRERPADGGIVWRQDLNAFECLGGCEDFHQVWKRRDRENPETMALLRELLVVEHTECWKYADVEMAKRARRHRKEKTRRENLKNRAGLALDRQSVSWRGR
jgi:hypothetical protein